LDLLGGFDTAGNPLQLKLRGMFKKADHDRIIQIAKEAIEPGGEGPCLHQFEGRSGAEIGDT
jgi:hypothetical protein